MMRFPYCSTGSQTDEVILLYSVAIEYFDLLHLQCRSFHPSRQIGNSKQFTIVNTCEAKQLKITFLRRFHYTSLSSLLVWIRTGSSTILLFHKDCNQWCGKILRRKWKTMQFSFSTFGKFGQCFKKEKHQSDHAVKHNQQGLFAFFSFVENIMYY